MARTKAPKKQLNPDLKYNSIRVSRLINYVMQKGKKHLATRIVYEVFDEIKKKTNIDPLEVFHKAIEQVTPKVEVRARRIGGSNIQIPLEVRPIRQLQLALRWIVKSAQNRKERGIVSCLTNELIDAHNGEGMAMKLRRDSHKSAQSHKTYAHLR